MLTTKEVISNYVNLGVTKAKNSTANLLLLSVVAGFFIALAGVAANTGTAGVENPFIAKVISAAIFPVGLGMVLCVTSELFTGDCLMFLSLFSKKITIAQLIRTLVIVYIGNLIGSIIIAWAVNYSGQIGAFNGSLAAYSIKIAVAKVKLDFGKAVVLGILCNFLVCIGVLMGQSATSLPGKLMGGFVPVFTFVAAGYEHSVANMYYIPAGLFAIQNPKYLELAQKAGIDVSNLNVSGFIHNLIPVTIGNIIGGVVFVAMIYYVIFLSNQEK